MKGVKNEIYGLFSPDTTLRGKFFMIDERVVMKTYMR